MPPRLNSRRLRRLAAACVTLFLILSAFGISLVRLEASQRSAAADRLLVAKAAEVRGALGDQLSQSINLARGLRAYVVAHPDLGDADRFDVLLEKLYEQGHHIRNIGVAPGNVISHVYPIEGNEGAIGLRYEDVQDQFPPIALAMRTNQPVLAGPVDLVQGGRGLIDRTPVFLPDGSYWGVVSLVLDVDSLLAGVARAVGDTDIEWAIRTVANDLAPATAVGGEGPIFDDADAMLTLAVPNGTWELAVRSDADVSHTTLVLVFSVVAVFIAALIGWLVFEATRARWRATTLSLHDDLTGLANRRLLEDRADQAVARARREQGAVSFVYVDLDAFKPINDIHGHEAGDAVLAEIANRLSDRVREADTVARVGGDEFVILLPGTGSDGARALTEGLARTIEQPIMFNGETLEVGASFGVASYPEDGDSFHGLLAHADNRMYEVKAGKLGRGKADAAVGQQTGRARHLRSSDRDDLGSAPSTG